MAIKCPKCNTDNPETQKICGKCGTQLIPAEKIYLTRIKIIDTPIEELATDSTFAKRYQIIEEIGKGGMGRVYRVEKFLDLWKDADPGIAEMVDARERLEG